MITINLLPRLHTITAKWLVGTVASILIIFLLHQYWRAVLMAKQDKITLLAREIQTINQEISKVEQKKPLSWSTDYQTHQQLFKLLKKLPQTMPIGLYLTELSMVKNRLNLIGYADNAEVIATWITTLTEPCFKIAITEITRKETVNMAAIRFCLIITCCN